MVVGAEGEGRGGLNPNWMAQGLGPHHLAQVHPSILLLSLVNAGDRVAPLFYSWNFSAVLGRSFPSLLVSGFLGPQLNRPTLAIR